jgi:CBS domain-containing protein
MRAAVLAHGDETVRQAIMRMREQQLGCVFIVDQDGRPIGMFTESVLNRLLVTEPKAIDEPLRLHMSRDWCSVKLNDPIHCVLAAMQARDVRFVCVLDDAGRVKAISGQKGLMEYIADHFPGQVMVQRIGCPPFVHHREGA